jgi:hypothetical protein
MRARRCLSATSRAKMASLSCPRFVNFDSAIDQKLILRPRAWLSWSRRMPIRLSMTSFKHNIHLV